MSTRVKQQRKRVRAVRSPQARRSTKEERDKALELCASGLRRQEVAKVMGTTTESLRRWNLAAASAKQAPTTAASASSAEEKSNVEVKLSGRVVREGGLAPVDQEAILELKKQHPSMGLDEKLSARHRL